MTKGPRQTFDEESSDENFAERELSFEERIDAKIAKDLKTLGQIKTMKAIGLGRSGPMQAKVAFSPKRERQK
jgi:hypothetical protein